MWWILSDDLEDLIDSIIGVISLATRRGIPEDDHVQGVGSFYYRTVTF
jgi:hypothetical protein